MKAKRRTLPVPTILLAAIMMIVGMSAMLTTGEEVYAEPGDIQASGTWGTCPWEIDDQGVLTVNPGMGINTAENSTDPGVSPWAAYADIITAANFVTGGGENPQYVVLPEIANSLLANMNNLTSVNLSGIDADSCKYMRGFLSSASQLTTVELFTVKNAHPEDMSGFFQGCANLEIVTFSDDAGTFETNEVTDYSYCFQGCTKCKGANINYSSAQNLESMYEGCLALDLNFQFVDFSNVITMKNMFRNCTGIGTLYFPDGWHGSVPSTALTNMSGMFKGCTKLRTYSGISAWNTSKVTDMSSMFEGCASIERLDGVSVNSLPQNTSSVTTFQNMFYGCSGLTSLDVTGFNTSAATNTCGMFAGCSGLTGLDITGFVTSNVTTMASMFYGCSGLSALDVSGFDTSKTTTLAGMFDGCSGLTALGVSGFVTGSSQSFSRMFAGCSGLTGLDLSGFSTANSTSFNEMFSGCTALKQLNISDFDTGKATSMQSMFNGCGALETITLGAKTVFNDTVLGDTPPPQNWQRKNDLSCAAFTTLAGYDKNYPGRYDVGTKELSITGIEGKTYDGTAQTQIAGVKLDDTALGDGTDYEVTYQNNKNAGTATMTFTGKGNYIGEAKRTFTIEKRGVTVSGITAEDKVYDGTTDATLSGTPTFTGRIDGDDLTVSGVVGTFADANAAEKKTVTLDYTKAKLEGESAANYFLKDDGNQTDTTADITPKPVTVSAPAGKTLTYNGKSQTGVASGKYYRLSGTTKAANAGSYSAKATLISDKNHIYTWTGGKAAPKTISWKINKAANPLTVKGKTAKVKFKKLKKKNQTLGVSKVIAFTNKGQGTMSYKLVSAKKGKKSFKKLFKVNTRTGKVTVKKGLKKGTYKVNVKVKAAGNANYKASVWKTVTVTIKVKK